MMDPQSLINSIRKNTRLTDAGEALIISKLIPRQFRKKEFINSEGEINRYTNFIVNGSARTYYIDHNGQEHTIQLAVTGWWIGDYASFILQQPGKLITEALEPVSTISISYDDLQWLYEKVPELERFFRLLTQNAYASFQQRVLHGMSLDAENRYLAFRETYPAMDLQISQKHIASYLGMSPEFLSKIKKRLLLKEKQHRRMSR